MRVLRALSLTLPLLWLAAGTEAYAQQPQGAVLNGQIQTGDVFADQELIVAEAVEGVASGTNAIGNSVSAVTTHQNLTYDNTQALNGSVASSAYVQTQGTSGPLFVNSVSATGNTGHAAVCCGYLDGTSHQVVQPNAVVSAYAESRTGGSVEHAASAASAIGNSQGYAAVNGNVGASTTQAHYGTTNAYNQVVSCCITGSGAFVATSVGNNMSSNVENGEAIHRLEQTMDGYETRATNDVYVVTGNEVYGTATATANNAHLYNTGGYAELESSQTNQSLVEAESYVALDTWYGTGSSVAYGVGNSVSLANVSPDPVINTSQLNNGDVNSYATFNGGYGENVFTSATSVGNAVSGYACSSCYGVIDANNRQENNGTVRAAARTTTGHAHFVTGTATAIGNSASYESTGN